jgi:radical SAM protein with 4Fe4S-binding SPASM domain
MEVNLMLDKYPVLQEGTSFHLWPNRGFLSYTTTPDVPRTTLAYNRSASAILTRFDGSHQIVDIIRELAQDFHTDEQEVTSMILGFVHESLEKIPMQLSDVPMTKTFRVTGDTRFITPMHASIELTYQCNLRCQHCYAQCGSRRLETMSLENTHKLLDILESWGVTVIELTGGEPTINVGFVETLVHAMQLFDLVGIVTNGTHFSGEIADVIAASPKKVAVQVDLHGCSEEYVDWFTGGIGTFKKEKATIRELARLDTITRVAMVVAPKSLSQVRETASLAKSLGATVFGISPVIPQGRGCDTSLLFSVKEYQTFIEMWNKLRQEFGNFIFHLEESPAAMATIPKHCGAGARSVSITPSGEVKMCQMSSTKMLSFGNAFELPASEIFGNGLAAHIANLTPPNSDVCGACDKFGFCINCINRGLMMATQLGRGTCKWYMECAGELSQFGISPMAAVRSRTTHRSSCAS